jgi:hypothetical protein
VTTSWSRREQFDAQVRRRRSVVFSRNSQRERHMEPREHYSTCASECNYPLTWDDDGEGHGNWECDVGHRTHDCTCDEVARSRVENEAEAIADMMSEQEA